MSTSDKDIRYTNQAKKTFKQSPILKLTREIEKNNLMTIDDNVLTHRILIGCSKLISFLSNSALKKKARGKSVFSKKNRTFAYLLASLLLKRGKKKNRQSNIKYKLPGTSANIQDADLWEILNNMVSLQVARTTNKQRHRGRPADEGVQRLVGPGPQTFYEDTDYVNSLRQVVSNSYARNLMYSYLFESGLFYRWLHCVMLFALYHLKFRGPRDFVNDYSHLNIYFVDEKLIRNLYRELNKLDEKELCVYAYKRALSIAEHYTDTVDVFRYFFSYTCILGGIFYPFILGLN